ncbi:MAG: 3-oxoacyl-[acyl-carrier-protein] reductase [Pseudomonadota bacterium]
MFDLTGRHALVTGASGGIGRAIAAGLHAQGAVVALSGTREEALREVAESLGDRAHVVPANLSDLTEADGLAAKAEAAMGGLDIVINNAGITRDNISMRMKDAEWDAVLALNLTAGFRIVRGSLKGLMKRRFGRIVSITSVVGHTGNAGQANYAAAKAGTTGMTKALAAEVASRGITVNCVAPGFIETPMTDALNEKQKDAIIGTVPAGRLGTPAEVAAACAYLASDEAAYVTGQTVHVNGGMAML